MLIEPTRDFLLCRYLRSSVLSIALMLCLSDAWADELSYGKEQIESYKELIENLENRHYEKFHYDNELSLKHLERYLMTLDQAKMYFSKSYIDQSITALKNSLLNLFSRAFLVSIQTLSDERFFNSFDAIIFSK